MASLIVTRLTARPGKDAFQIFGREGVLERGAHGNSGKRGKRRLPSAFPRSSVLSVIQILARLEFAKILKCTPGNIELTESNNCDIISIDNYS
jgi:hypothetical protein